MSIGFSIKTTKNFDKFSNVSNSRDEPHIVIPEKIQSWPVTTIVGGAFAADYYIKC